MVDLGTLGGATARLRGERRRPGRRLQPTPAATTHAFSWTRRAGWSTSAPSAALSYAVRGERRTARWSATAIPPAASTMRSCGRSRAGWSISVPSAALELPRNAVNDTRPGRRLQPDRRQPRPMRSRGRSRAGWSISAPSAAAYSVRQRGQRTGQVVGYSATAGDTETHASCGENHRK